MPLLPRQVLLRRLQGSWFLENNNNNKKGLLEINKASRKFGENGRDERVAQGKTEGNYSFLSLELMHNGGDSGKHICR